MNYWDELMATDEGASQYMESYGEGPGSDTRHLIGAFINDGESVLDVGCGPGWNWEHFNEHGPKLSAYKGLDYSQRFVRVANKRVGQEVFFVGDVRDIPEEKNSWDVVLLQDVLEHTNGYEKPIKEALRVARKRVIITFWKGSFQGDNNAENQINDDGDDGYGATYNRKEFEEFLDSLDIFWTESETEPGANRWHKLYVIDKEEPK